MSNINEPFRVVERGKMFYVQRGDMWLCAKAERRNANAACADMNLGWQQAGGPGLVKALRKAINNLEGRCGGMLSVTKETAMDLHTALAGFKE